LVFGIVQKQFNSVMAENGIAAKDKPVESPIVVPDGSAPVGAKPEKRMMSEAARAKISAAAKLVGRQLNPLARNC
jgi:hypothetical protein